MSLFFISMRMIENIHYLEELTSFPLEQIDQVPEVGEGEAFLAMLKKQLFSNEHHTKGKMVFHQWQAIESALSALLRPVLSSLEEVRIQSEQLMRKFPDLYARILEDGRMLLKFDPAAHSLGEVIHFYPGFHAIFVYRLAHELYVQGVPVLPRMLSEIAHTQTGIDIHPGATIGRSFFIDHGTGIVIGETTEIGDRVRIYQGVTLGALTVRKEDARIKRHPTIEDDVVLYAGSTILGGKTTIGRSSVIGGNVWLTKSVPAYSRVYHTSKVEIRNAQEAAMGFQI